MSIKKLYVTGGSIIPQSDWNQTDDTQADFIKNKPEDLATETYVNEYFNGEKQANTVVTTSLTVRGGNADFEGTINVPTPTQSFHATNKKYVDDTIGSLKATDIGALTTDDLEAAVDIALANAKASGEFDGPVGEVGPQGEKGEKGDQGEVGPRGADGSAGYTPIKGTDYYTEADKTEMVGLVINALPTWEGGSY